MKELSKYEFARIIGARALQLSLGAPPMIKLKKGQLDPLLVSKLEYEADILPLTVLA